MPTVPTMRERSVAVVLGTRPEAIKLASVVEQLGSAARVISTGQHHDGSLWGKVLEGLDFAPPAEALAVGGRSRVAQIGAAISALGAAFEDERPAAVVVQGDTNASVAGAMAANACEVPLVHVEAGLRSHDRAMPEEHNRVVADHLADLCLAPTEVSRANLLAESIPDERIRVTGNTVVEAVLRLLPPPDEVVAAVHGEGLEVDRYALATFHRPENVDDADVLATILDELAALPVPVVLPLHPRTVQRIDAFGLGDRVAGGSIRVLEPLAPRAFLALAAAAAVLVSDSGGVQEEASVLKRPVVVVRRSTERPEVQGTFATLVPAGPEIGRVAGELLADIGAVHRRLASLPSPYGEGDAAARSVAAITELLGR